MKSWIVATNGLSAHWQNILKHCKTCSQNTSSEANNFRENVRKYNSAFSFASFGASTASLPGHGTYCYRIHRQTYHSTSTLHPDNEEERQYCQLYIIEGDEAVGRRMIASQNSDCRQDVMEEIQQVLHRPSKPIICWGFQTHACHRAGGSATYQQRATTSRLYFKLGPDCKRYNEPRHDEVAAVRILMHISTSTQKYHSTMCSMTETRSGEQDREEETGYQ